MGLFNNIFNRTLTLNDLIQIDQGRMERSQYVDVTLEKVYHRVRKESLWDKVKAFFKRDKVNINMYYVILKFIVSSNSGNKYTVLIEFQPNSNVYQLMNSKVRVYCDCPSFKFQSAYTLNRHGNLYRSAKTDVELGQALTDPPGPKTKVSMICKHVYACVSWLNNNLNYVVSQF